MSLEDDEALFEDLYGDDESKRKSRIQSKEVESTEKETTAVETASATENASSAEVETTTEGESESVPPPPPPPIPASGDVNAQSNTAQDNATSTAPGSVPAGMPQFPFDPAQFQQYAAANGLQFPGNANQQNFGAAGESHHRHHQHLLLTLHLQSRLEDLQENVLLVVFPGIPPKKHWYLISKNMVILSITIMKIVQQVVPVGLDF